MRRFFAFTCALLSVTVLYAVIRIPLGQRFAGEFAPAFFGERNAASRASKAMTSDAPDAHDALLQGETFAELALSTDNPSEIPIKDAEIHAFAQSLQEAVMNADIEATIDHFHWEKFIDLRDGEDHDGLSLRTRARIAREANSEKAGPMREIVHDITAGGGLRFLRIVGEGTSRRPFFRLHRVNGTFEYYEWFLCRGPERVLAFDIYIYSFGERYSQVLRRLATLFKPVTTPDEQREQTQLSDYSRLMTAIRSGEAGDGDAVLALELYQKLPVASRRNISLMRGWVELSTWAGGDAAEKALHEFQNAFPTFPTMPMLEVSVFSQLDDHARTHAAIDRVDRLVGGDPYLQVVHSRVYSTSGKPDLARSSAEAAIEAESDSLPAYLELLRISLDVHDYARAADFLTFLRDEFNEDTDELIKQEVFQGFLQSPEYAAWKKASAEDSTMDR